MSLSLRPKPSIGAVRLSFRPDRFGLGTGAGVVDSVCELLPALVLSVLDVPFEAEKPRAEGDAGDADGSLTPSAHSELTLSPPPITRHRAARGPSCLPFSTPSTAHAQASPARA